jgi:hypothetical protein
MEFHFEQLLPVSVVLVVWFEPVDINAIELNRQLPPELFARFSGTPQLFPLFGDPTAPIFRTDLDNGSRNLGLLRSAVQFSWQRKQPDEAAKPFADMPGTLDSFMATLRKVVPALQVKRFGSVSNMAYPLEEPAKFAASRFCDTKWKHVADPAGTDFQIHFHDICSSKHGVPLNRWMRFKTGVVEGGQKSPALLVETDINSLVDAKLDELVAAGKITEFFTEHETLVAQRARELLLD